MVETLFRWLEEFRRANLVHWAFGEPYQKGDRTVIPVAIAEVRVDWPAGSQAAPGSLPTLAESTSARPVALISVGEDGVRVVPEGARPLLWTLGAVAAVIGAIAGWRLGRTWRA